MYGIISEQQVRDEYVPLEPIMFLERLGETMEKMMKANMSFELVFFNIATIVVGYLTYWEKE